MKSEFRRAFSTLGCPSRNLPEVLALAALHRIDGVEIRTLENSLDIPAVFARMGEATVRQALREHPHVRLVSLDTSFRLVGATAEDREALLSFVPWAEALGVPWLRVFDGGEMSDPDFVPKAVESLAWWRGLRRERGWRVDVMIETHDGLLAPEVISRFCAEADRPTLLWDAHNTWRKTGVDPVRLWPSFAAHVVHVHVKDSVSRPSQRLPYTYALPGEGEFPMRALCEALKSDGYAHVLSLEWERQWHPELPSLDAALKSARDCGWW